MAHDQQKMEFEISRVFDVPRDRLWRTWAEREQLEKWFGPKGCTISAARHEFRPGGIFHYSMRLPDGKRMWGKFVYREIVPNQRIVWVNSFSDENAGITRHPLKASWPREMLPTAEFAGQGDKTKLTIRWKPLDPSDEERQTFEANFDSMQTGWTGTFEQLADYLAKSENARGAAV